MIRAWFDAVDRWLEAPAVVLDGMQVMLIVVGLLAWVWVMRRRR
jgi:hypothetical protein